MKKIFLVMMFVVMLTGSVFAMPDLPNTSKDYNLVIQEKESGSYELYSSTEPMKLYPSKSGDVLYCFPSPVLFDKWTYSSDDGQEWVQQYTDEDYFFYSVTDYFRPVDGRWDSSSDEAIYQDVVYSDYDLVFGKSSGDIAVDDVFFSAPVASPVEELPELVISQVAIVAGAGILLISLTLLPGLLKKLWAFL